MRKKSSSSGKSSSAKAVAVGEHDITPADTSVSSSFRAVSDDVGPTTASICRSLARSAATPAAPPSLSPSSCSTIRTGRPSTPPAALIRSTAMFDASMRPCPMIGSEEGSSRPIVN